MKEPPYNKLFVPTYKREGAPMVRGKGMYLYDKNGRKYLDFGSGIAVTALGHSHPAIVAALRAQGSKLIHASNLYHMEPQIRFVNLLVKHSFGSRVFLCNSGTEATEAAIKFARKWATRKNRLKYHVLSFTDGFHGRTYGGLSATAQKKFHAGYVPMVPGFHYAPYDDIAATKKVLRKHDYAAVFVEPVQGESGINSAAREFLTFLRAYTNKHAIALVFDEVQCGVGRTGLLWAHQHFGVTPDMMTLAKPIGGGLPLGAVVCKDTISRVIQPGDHGTTFGGNPLACALGEVVLRMVSKKSFLAGVRSKGAYLKGRLEKLAGVHDTIREVRGFGLMVGVEMDADPSKIIAACRAQGLLVVKAGHNTVRFMPPLVVTRADIDKAVRLFSKVLGRRAR
ncbi:MAG: acetylornithine/succinylornithine family transaminase [Chitinivibrionales bacterium]|nr:acetylornithine/succinylornithine family transaminase [Chitinivibrionales bacterium]MBD3395620.1 acetylornithine/succinylornithine family transaminase [Chitinivibrionales bacterium]